jgi:hypothetical protein
VQPGAQRLLHGCIELHHRRGEMTVAEVVSTRCRLCFFGSQCAPHFASRDGHAAAIAVPPPRDVQVNGVSKTQVMSNPTLHLQGYVAQMSDGGALRGLSSPVSFWGIFISFALVFFFRSQSRVENVAMFAWLASARS